MALLIIPSIKGRAVTPHDLLDIPMQVNGLWVGGAGDLTVIMRHDDDTQAVTLKAVPAGYRFENFAVRRVLATGTTATLIVALQ